MDFAALAAGLAAGLDDVRACVVLSGDGLTLGAFPETEEERARSAWSALQAAGDPQRGFVAVGEEVWVLARRGSYIGVVVSGAACRPGVVLDRLDAALRSAEEARLGGGAEAPPARPQAPRRSRRPLHPQPRTPDRDAPKARAPRRAPPQDVVDVTAAERAEDDPAGAPKDPAAEEAPPQASDPQVDRIALAREFGLLGDPGESGS